MSEWQEKRIKNVCIIGDGAHASLNRTDGGILYLTSKNFKQSGLSLDTVDYISEETYNKYFKKSAKALTKPKQDDVLLSIIGTMGAPYLVKRNDIFGLSSSVSIIRPDLSVIDSKYLFYWIKSPIFQGAISQIKSGVAQSFLSLPMIGSLPLKFPKEIIQQKKIAKILSNYDDLIENNLKRIKLLEESARLTYEEWFWKKISLSSLGEFLNGYAFKPKDLLEDGLPVIKIKEMKAGVVSDTPRNPGLGIDKKYLVCRGDILFSWSATLEVIQWQYEEGLVNQHLFKVTPNKDMSKSLLYLVLKDSIQIFDYLTTGATMKHIKRKELDFVKATIPTKELMTRFENKVEPMLSQVLNLSHQNQLLKEARDILLPRLMTGMIDVEELEIAV